MRGLLSFRMGRLRYLIWTVVCLPLVATAGPFIGPDAQIAYVRPWVTALPYLFPLIWAFIAAAPRLRDIGWSSWLACAPLAASLVAGLLATSWGAGPPWSDGVAAAFLLGAVGFVLLLAVKGPRKVTLDEVFS